MSAAIAVQINVNVDGVIDEQLSRYKRVNSR